MREYTPEQAAAIAADKRAKAERRNELAAKRAADADAAFERARNATAGIPLGQPILADHYSARRHRAALRRSDAAMTAGVDNAGKSRYHADKATRAEAWANEVERRAAGPVYTPADLKPGDRLNDSNRPGTVHLVVVRVNAKSVTAYAVHSAPFDAGNLAPVWACADLNPGKVPYLKVREAWREADGVWVPVAGTGPGAVA